MRLAGALLTVALGALAAAWLRQEQAAEEAFWASEPRPLPGWTLPISGQPSEPIGWRDVSRSGSACIALLGINLESVWLGDSRLMKGV